MKKKVLDYINWEIQLLEISILKTEVLVVKMKKKTPTLTSFV